MLLLLLNWKIIWNNNEAFSLCFIVIFLLWLKVSVFNFFLVSQPYKKILCYPTIYQNLTGWLINNQINLLLDWSAK